jgi:hypothetical protein
MPEFISWLVAAKEFVTLSGVQILERCFDISMTVTSQVAMPELRTLVACFPRHRPGFDPSWRRVGPLMDIVTMGEVSSKYFGSAPNSHSTDFCMSINHRHFHAT